MREKERKRKRRSWSAAQVTKTTVLDEFQRGRTVCRGFTFVLKASSNLFAELVSSVLWVERGACYLGIVVWCAMAVCGGSCDGSQ